MRVHLRLNEKANGSFQTVENTKFSSSLNNKFSLSPIPPFLEGSKCKCGKPAEVILNDCECSCLDCIKPSLKGSRVIKEETLSSLLNEDTINGIMFEWSIDGNRWYTIYGRKIQTDQKEKFFSRLKKILLTGGSILLDAEYDRDNKEMTVFKIM